MLIISSMNRRTDSCAADSWWRTVRSEESDFVALELELTVFDSLRSLMSM